MRLVLCFALCLPLLAACGSAKKTLYPFEREYGFGGGGWTRRIKGKEIEIHAEGSTVRIRHGGYHFEFLNIRSFQGTYSFYTFEIRGDTMNAFYSPKGLSVKRREKQHHWKPEELPTGVKIVIEGVDIRYEALEVSGSGS
ncbi:MAG: hypothetical protein ACYS0F_02550 [Planctomycetota bacterium]|jgi:hypothetical protein